MTPEEIKQAAQKEKEKCEELEDMAFQGAELPKGLPFPQQLLFLKFRYLYLFAKMTQMPPDQGKREKQEILAAYMIDRVNDAIYQSNGRLWKNIESAAVAIQQDHDLMRNEKIRNLLNEIYATAV